MSVNKVRVDDFDGELPHNELLDSSPAIPVSHVRNTTSNTPMVRFQDLVVLLASEAASSGVVLDAAPDNGDHMSMTTFIGQSVAKIKLAERERAWDTHRLEMNRALVNQSDTKKDIEVLLAKVTQMVDNLKLGTVEHVAQPVTVEVNPAVDDNKELFQGIVGLLGFMKLVDDSDNVPSAIGRTMDSLLQIDPGEFRAAITTNWDSTARLRLFLRSKLEAITKQLNYTNE